MKKTVTVFITVYILAFIYNTLTIVLHPDMPIKMTHTLISSLLLVMTLVIIRKALKMGKYKAVILGLIPIYVSALSVYLIDILQIRGFLYGLVSLLFTLFISPFYGINYFNLSYIQLCGGLSIFLTLILFGGGIYRKIKQSKKAY